MLDYRRTDGAIRYHDPVGVDATPIKKPLLHNENIIVVCGQGLVERRVVPTTSFISMYYFPPAPSIILPARSNTHIRCNGTEVNPNTTHKQVLNHGTAPRFLTLGTPISSHRPFACALSTSTRVGALKHCMQ